MSERDLSLLLSHLEGENRREELAVLQRELERAEREGDSGLAASILARKNALRMAAVRDRKATQK